MAPPLPNQNLYTGYVPVGSYTTYQVNKGLYASLGRPTPDHYFFWDGSQYRVSYADPYTAVLVYQGSEVQQLEQAGLTVDVNVENPAQSVVTVPATPGKTTTTTLKSESGTGSPKDSAGKRLKAGDYGAMIMAGGIGLLLLAIFGRKR